MNEKNISKKEFSTFKGRILKCLGDKKPSPWGISIGLSRGAVSRIFGRDKIPTWEHLVLISESLGKSIDWLLTGKEHPKDKISELDHCMDQCSQEERHTARKLIEILRHDNEIQKKVITHTIDLFCGDRLWVRQGRPERRVKPNGLPGMPERRTKVFLYKNDN